MTILVTLKCWGILCELWVIRGIEHEARKQ